MPNIINVTIRNKIATADKTIYVCGNTDFMVNFDFDAEWDAFSVKTVRFINGDEYVDILMDGNQCAMPLFSNTNTIKVGVFAGDLRTTTSAFIMAQKSILCGGSGTPKVEQPDIYSQLLDQLNEEINRAETTVRESVEDLVSEAVSAEASAKTSAENAEDSAETAANEAARATNNILNGVSTHNADSASHQDIRQGIREVENIAKGRNHAVVFDTFSAMTEWLKVASNVATLEIGTNLYIRELNVPDYWWDGTTYQELEVEHPDLTQYATKVELQANIPLVIEQSDYNALVENGTLQANRIYYVVMDGELG